MAYHQTSEYDHDDHIDDHGYIAIGEVRSEEDGQLACLTLFELGIPSEMAHGESEVDAIRRFLENWSTGQLLFVKPEDAGRALAAVGPRLEPTQIWTDTALYLEQCTKEQLFKLFDFREIWREPWELQALITAERVLAARGIVYPPDGASRKLPVVCLILSSLLGPYALVMHWHIRKMRPTKEGGRRPRYDEQTRSMAKRRLNQGLVVWLAWIVLFVIVEKARISRLKEIAPHSYQPSVVLQK